MLDSGDDMLDPMLIEELLEVCCAIAETNCAPWSVRISRGRSHAVQIPSPGQERARTYRMDVNRANKGMKKRGFG
ncbi:MAG: hypothetical protein KA091_02630 [Methanoregulaceae archaeon]|nr:hypothetical protein [Methanoregulaceae archaeon]